MTESVQADGVHPMIALECPWCAAPAHVVDDAQGPRFVCPECAVSAPIVPGPRAEMAAAA